MVSGNGLLIRTSLPAAVASVTETGYRRNVVIVSIAESAMKKPVRLHQFRPIFVQEPNLASSPKISPVLGPI